MLLLDGHFCSFLSHVNTKMATLDVNSCKKYMIEIKDIKKLFFERCYRIKTAFSLNFDYSLHFDIPLWKPRQCIFGLSNDLLQRFQEASSKSATVSSARVVTNQSPRDGSSSSRSTSGVMSSTPRSKFVNDQTDQKVEES
jgi:hypothetical protein